MEPRAADNSGQPAHNGDHAAHDSIYEVVFPAPDVAGVDNQLTLVIALKGYADAGHAVALSADHLLEALEHRPVVNFSNDELIDYRSRRPAVTMHGDEIVEMAELELSLDIVQDNSGTPFLLLSGPEPDLRWNSFANVVADLAEKYHVTRTVSLYAAPMPVPHTRPLGILGHGNDREAITGTRQWHQRITVPGSASLRIEYELNRRGRSTSGFTAQVPHYVAQSEYPLASLRLLEQVARLGNLDLPLEALVNESDRIAAMLAEQTAESHEVTHVVHMLEEQYDEEERQRALFESNPLLGPDGTMPSADEIGAEFERFLASQLVSRESEEDEQSAQDDEHEENAQSAQDEATSADEATAADGFVANAAESVEGDEAAPDDAAKSAEPVEDTEPAAESADSDEQLDDATAESDVEKPAPADRPKPRRPRGWTSWFKF